MLVGVLLFGATLVVVACLATSYVMLSRVACVTFAAVPVRAETSIRTYVQTRAAIDDAPERFGAADERSVEPSGEQPEARGQRALHVAIQADPDIAALLADKDPNVREAIGAFFSDDPWPESAAP
jgi:hypothetical protein